MKTASKTSVDEKLSTSKENKKIFIVPSTFGDPIKESDKDAFSPMEIKPGLLFPEFYEKGLDNPAYYDPADTRKAARMDAKKQKFTSKCIPGETNGAKLTKIPGLNIWRLDFRKPASNSRRATSSWYRLATSLAMVAVLALVISGIAVIVHAVKGGLIFGLPWFPFEDESNALGVSRVATHFRIMNRDFVSELNDRGSGEYLQLVAELKHSLDVLFMDSPLINYYNASDDFEFNNGSVIVRCIVLLNRLLPDGAQRVGFAFVRALEDGKGILPPGMFYIDVHTVRFAAIKIESHELSLENLHETTDGRNCVCVEPREDLGRTSEKDGVHYKLGKWSEWSTCTKNGSCDNTRIRVRRRHCGTSKEDLCGTHTEVVETRPCLCPLPALTATLTTSSLLLPGQWSEWSVWSSCLTFQKLCDPQQIQRRTRGCFGPNSRLLPNTVCYRKTGESAMQIRHCMCAQIEDDSAQEESEMMKETTLQIENDYMHWLIPV